MTTLRDATGIWLPDFPSGLFSSGPEDWAGLCQRQRLVHCAGDFQRLGRRYLCDEQQARRANINRDCGSTHIEGLQAFVVENQLDVGFAYDGDADRCLAVDEKGNVINGDLILYIYGRYMKERGKLLNNTIGHHGDV